jgi:hypothetical protein
MRSVSWSRHRANASVIDSPAVLDGPASRLYSLLVWRLSALRCPPERHLLGRFMADGKPFAIRTYGDEFLTGRCDNGDQILMGLLCPNVAVYIASTPAAS